MSSCVSIEVLTTFVSREKDAFHLQTCLWGGWGLFCWYWNKLLGACSRHITKPPSVLRILHVSNYAFVYHGGFFVLIKPLS